MKTVGITAWIVLLAIVVSSWVSSAPATFPARSGTASASAAHPSSKEMVRPELRISTATVPLAEVSKRLPNADAWSRFLAREAPDAVVHIDPRSGTPASIIASVPLIPGDGKDNRLTLENLESALGKRIDQVSGEVVADVVLGYILKIRELLDIDTSQLGPVAATRVSEELWQISIPQQVNGVPVRYGRVLASLSHGNLVTIGTELWGNAHVDTGPRISMEEAERIGFAYIGGKTSGDRLRKPPELEILVQTPPGRQLARSPDGRVGEGYGHRLVWAFTFERTGEASRWDVAVDAHSGELVMFQDAHIDANKTIKGGVQPYTNTDVLFPCPEPWCGAQQSGYPMPWANTGLASPKDVAGSAGVFDYVSGTVTTTLVGKYFRIVDDCGSISASSASGAVNLGSGALLHDCTVPSGASAGNTTAARTAFYELNKVAEVGRGWLPNNTWLTSQVTARTNRSLGATCQASWNDPVLSFWGSGQPTPGCRNVGEIQAIIDHEWGHGLDDNDANGTLLAGWTEAYADIAAIYKQRQSCIGYGYRLADPASDTGCGLTADSTGYNANAAMTGPSECVENCSGLRDADYRKHASGTPATPVSFTCTSCLSGAGGCGRNGHCAAAPIRQAAWDLATEGLPGLGFEIAAAFNVASRLFHLGSGNVGQWHNCDCGAGTSDGCGSSSGYMQWIIADDDDGNINNGTPHMTAIYSAFDTHGIACPTPTPVDSGCAAGPTAAPPLTVAPKCGGVDLSWSSVSGASKYWVFRSEGNNAGALGQALIARPTGLSHHDRMLQNGRAYCYSVLAAGSSDSCIGSGDILACVTPLETLPDSDDPLAKVTYPNGGQTLSIGSNATLRWDATDSCAVTTVDLLISRTGSGGTYTPIFTNIANTGSKSWTVTGPATTNAFLKVVARDGANHSGQDLSDSAILIQTCGPCQTSYCSAEGIRCTFNNTCGAGSCCNYTCSSDPSCFGPDPCPSGACSCF